MKSGDPRGSSRDPPEERLLPERGASAARVEENLGFGKCEERGPGGLVEILAADMPGVQQATRED